MLQVTRGGMGNTSNHGHLQRMVLQTHTWGLVTNFAVHATRVHQSLAGPWRSWLALSSFQSGIFS